MISFLSWAEYPESFNLTVKSLRCLFWTEDPNFLDVFRSLLTASAVKIDIFWRLGIAEDGLADYLYTRKQRNFKKKVGIKKKGLKAAKGLDTLARPKKQKKKNEKSN